MFIILVYTCAVRTFFNSNTYFEQNIRIDLLQPVLLTNIFIKSVMTNSYRLLFEYL